MTPRFDDVRAMVAASDADGFARREVTGK